jgi:hypothetical protein
MDIHRDNWNLTPGMGLKLNKQKLLFGGFIV